jgi:hypothetical protein
LYNTAEAGFVTANSAQCKNEAGIFAASFIEIIKLLLANQERCHSNYIWRIFFKQKLIYRSGK